MNIKMTERGYVTADDGARTLLPQFNGTSTWIGALGVSHQGNQIAVSKDAMEVASGMSKQWLSMGWSSSWFFFLSYCFLLTMCTYA